MTDSFYTTKEGLEKMKAEVQEMKAVRRPEVAARIAKARELGDLSENAEYAEAQEQMSFLEGKIIDREAYINRAVIIDGNAVGSGVVRVGSTVTVHGNGNEKTYMIVGSNETDPSAGKISNETPIAKALLGHRQGEAVQVTTPAGAIEYTIVSVS